MTNNHYRFKLYMLWLRASLIEDNLTMALIDVEMSRTGGDSGL